MAPGYMEEIGEKIGKGPELNFERGRPHSTNVSDPSFVGKNDDLICILQYKIGRAHV